MCGCVGVHELKVAGAGSTVRLLPVGKETINCSLTMDLLSVFHPLFAVAALNVC